MSRQRAVFTAYSRLRTLCCGVVVGLLFAICAGGFARAVQAPNPRGTGENVRTQTSVYSAAPTTGTTASAAPGVSARADVQSRRAVARPAAVTAAPRVAVSNLPGGIVARAGRTPIAGGTPGAIAARSATATTTARATAVFNDMTKMGVGYAQCYEAFNTCMDQFCAAANNTYRRCFCSQQFKEFRDAGLAIDQAKTLLLKFNDNNLAAVDKTAEEVQAMYKATEGENAIRRDTSASSKMLAQIEDLLAGRSKPVYSGQTVDLSSINFLDISDIWANPDDWFATSGRNMSSLEGLDLYNESNRQCTNATARLCEDATIGMIRSAYSILIAQDCSTFERKIAADRETIRQTVREAQNILRQARLEEYRAHNSPDVNACLSKVRDQILSETVCGAGFRKCLDPTGMYINSTTGDPIYSPRLFNLTSLISLTGEEDVLAGNASFARELDGKRKFAEIALDGCRSIADTVWTEFKRAAIIEIAQAQDAAIESVKNTCVSTMGQCYNTQTNALNSFDNTTIQASGALSASAARAMCADKVLACAALWGGEGSEPCRLSGGQVVNAATCGLQSLLTFVKTVDDMRATEGCKTAVANYARELCTATSGTYGYPFGCRLRPVETLRKQLQTFANPPRCATDADAETVVENIMFEIKQALSYQLQNICTQYGGIWATDVQSVTDMGAGNVALEPSFLYAVYGGIENLRNATKTATGAAGFTMTTDVSGKTVIETVTNVGYGLCILNTVANQCRQQDKDTGGYGYVTFNPITGECDIDEGWFKIKCESTLLGKWNSSSKTCLYKGTD